MADPMLNRHSREDEKPNNTSPDSLITDHIDIWTTAIERKSSAGRGTSNKFSLYGIKKLRELILELAVRGKLVPQDVNDEPASILLERIAAEKAQLVKDGKLKKQKPLPEISEDEKPFELPNGWEWSRLNDVYDVRDGTHNTPKYQDSGYPLVTSKNLSSGRLDFSDVKFISEDAHFEIAQRSNVEQNDILFAMIGSIGNAVIVDTDIDFSIKNVALFKYYSKKLASPDYLLRFLSFAEIKFKLEASGAVQSFVSLGKVRSFIIALPPLEEQHRIVAKVEELMGLCDALEAQTEASISAHQTLVETLLNALLQPNTNQPAVCPELSLIESLASSPEPSFADSLEPALNESFVESWQRVAEHFDTLFTTAASIDTLKQTILQLAVMGKLVPQDPNDEPATKLLERIAAEKAQLIKDGRIKKQKTLPVITDEEKSFELPNGWVYTRLDELCLSVSSGSTPPKSELNETSGIPFLKVYNIQNQVIDFEERTLFVSEGSHLGKLKRSILYPGDVVMNLVGPPLGKIAIIPNTYPEWNCNQNIICFRPLEIRLNLYIYTYLTAQIFLNQIELVGSAGQDFISGTKSRAIVLPFPPLEEQHRIVAKVDELMTLCDQLKARLSDAQTTQLHLTDAIVEQAG